MGNDALWGLVFIYGVISAVLIAYTFYQAKVEMRLSLATLVRAMWVLVFCVVPFMIHLYVYNNGRILDNLLSFDYSEKGIYQFYLAALFSIIGFIGLNFGYRVKFIFANTKRKSMIVPSERSDVGYSDTVLSVSAFVMFVIGLGALILWTRAYGGIRGVLAYASALRSGEDIGITNSFTVFKRFAPLLQFANMIYLAMWKKDKNPFHLIMFVVTLVFSTYYLLANDGRAPTVVHFVALLWIWITLTKKKDVYKKPNYVLIVSLVLIALFVMHNFDAIYITISTGASLELSLDIFAALRDEFSFTTRNIQAVFLALEDDPFMFKLPSEIINGICGILPSSFRPDWLVNLEVFNTEYWVMGAAKEYYGGKPPDIISTGIYTMNYMGIFLLPMFFGMILKKLDEYFVAHSSMFSKILFANLLYPAVRTVAYTNFNGLTLNVFYIALGCLIIWFIDKCIGKRAR